MKTCQRFLLQCAISFLVPPLLFAGCSLIGLGIGALSDAGKKGGAEVSGLSELRTFELGTGIVLVTHEGTRIEGDFVGIQESKWREYRQAYLAAIETLKVRDQLPVPGDTITFNRLAGAKVRGAFRGVDPGVLLLWQKSGVYPLAAIRNLQGDSARPLDVFALHVLTEGGRLPYCARGVLVGRRNDTTEVPVEDILRIEKDAGGNAKLTGFLVGAVIDAVVVIAVAASCNETARQNTESCNKGWGPNNSGCNK